MPPTNHFLFENSFDESPGLCADEANDRIKKKGIRFFLTIQMYVHLTSHNSKPEIQPQNLNLVYGCSNSTKY